MAEERVGRCGKIPEALGEVFWQSLASLTGIVQNFVLVRFWAVGGSGVIRRHFRAV